MHCFTVACKGGLGDLCVILFGNLDFATSLKQSEYTVS